MHSAVCSSGVQIVLRNARHCTALRLRLAIFRFHAQQVVRQVQWQPEVERYLLAIVRATRKHADIQLGASPRGTLALYRACEAYAAIQGRDYVEPDDVKLLAPHLLTHRLLTTTRTRMRGQRALEIMTEILAAMPAPVEMIAPPPGKR